MRDISTGSFKYSGQKYFFSATLYTNSSLHFSTHALNNENIVQFEYTNAANQLYITASIVYDDKYGIVDKYFAKQFPYCNIVFAEIQEKKDGELTVDEIDDTRSFKHTFFIRNVEILDRQDTIIRYKIHLVSNNWILENGSIKYSNYGKEPESIIDLIKNMLSYNKLKINSDTFDKIKSEVKINYITHENDNTLTTIKYLLPKLYYYDKKDSALKFLFYHEIKDEYGMFDLSNKDTSLAMYSVILSLFKTNSEMMLNEEPINFGSITTFSKTKSFKNIFNYKIDDYDYGYNTFVDKSIKSEDVIQFENKRFQDSAYEDKFEKIFDTTLKFSQSGTYWNNDNFINIYNNVTKSLFEDNAFTINTAGVLARKPSDFININVDRSLKFDEDQEPEKLDDIKNKYKTFEGVWIASKVHNYIFPNIGKYRQVTTMFRNFTPADINDDAK